MLVEDKSLDIATRAQAAKEIGKIGTKASAVRLATCLDDDLGALFLQIVVALGRLGNYEVLPQLERIEQSAPDISGKSMSALRHTISALKKKKAEEQSKQKS